MPPQSKGLTPDDLQQIRPNDTSVTLSKIISQSYQEMINERE